MINFNNVANVLQTAIFSAHCRRLRQDSRVPHVCLDLHQYKPLTQFGIRSSKVRSRVFIPAFAAIMLFAFQSTGQSIAEVVAQRQQDMKAMAAAAKAIAAMFKSPETYSPTTFKDAAETIKRHSGARLVADFATLAAAKGSEANELIAGERERFAQLSDDLQRYADAVAHAASDRKGSIPDDMRMRKGETVSGGPLGKRTQNDTSGSAMSAEHAFHMMLETCTSCHARYRLRD